MTIKQRTWVFVSSLFMLLFVIYNTWIGAFVCRSVGDLRQQNVKLVGQVNELLAMTNVHVGNLQTSSPIGTTLFMLFGRNLVCELR